MGFPEVLDAGDATRECPISGKWGGWKETRFLFLTILGFRVFKLLRVVSPEHDLQESSLEVS